MGLSSRRAATGLAAIAAAVVALSPLTVSAPAAADVTGSTSSGNVVLYPQCQRHEVDYHFTVSPNTYFWSLEIQVESPTGLQSEGVVLTKNNSPQSGNEQSGTVSPITFCGSEPPGRWTVHATGVYEFFPGAPTTYALPDSTFQVRRAATHTTLSAKKLHHHRVRLTATVTDERVDGFGRTEGAAVDLERLVDGTWQRVRKSRERTVHGHTTTVVRATRGATYRALTYGRGNYDGSTSGPLTIR